VSGGATDSTDSPKTFSHLQTMSSHVASQEALSIQCAGAVRHLARSRSRGVGSPANPHPPPCYFSPERKWQRHWRLALLPRGVHILLVPCQWWVDPFGPVERGGWTFLTWLPFPDMKKKYHRIQPSERVAVSFDVTDVHSVVTNALKFGLQQK